jgi:hypothetical protein
MNMHKRQDKVVILNKNSFILTKMIFLTNIEH